MENFDFAAETDFSDVSDELAMDADSWIERMLS